MTVLKSLGVLLVLTMFIHLPTPAKSQTNCQSSFLTRFLQCVSNSTLNPQHFLWLTRDRQMGSQPPDIPAFTQQACLEQTALSTCFKQVVDQYDSLPTGCSDADKNAIKEFFRNVVRNLDSKCAHPCRDQLIPSLGECFTSAGVNGTLFLSNITKPRHQILGDNDDDVDVFCLKREEILQCMTTKTEMCPETPDILSAAGLDVTALNYTVSLLCDNRQLYQHGVRCSVNRSLEEEQCEAALLREVSEIETRFEDRIINRTVYAVNVCRVRLDHIRCDLNSLSSRDMDTKCPDEVVGLRREQECTLLPANCTAEFKARVTDMCDPIRFLTDKRKDFIRAQNQTSGGRRQVLDSALAAVAMATAVLVSLVC